MLSKKQWFNDMEFQSIMEHPTINSEWQRIKSKEANKNEKEDGGCSSNDEALPDEDYFELDEYKYENDRHRIITAMIISDLFIYMLKHFKANCINQFVYLSQLLVDANGVLVLLKFLNQGFEKFSFDKSQQLDQKCPFL